MKDLYALFRHSLAGLRVLIAATLLLGVAYPLVVYGVAAVAAPWQAHGSLVTATGAHTTDADDAVGSALLGQVVDDAGLFQNRPSAAGDGYDPLSSYGSNLGPESPDLVAAIKRAQGRDRRARGRRPRRRTRRTRSPPPAPASTPTSRRRTPPSRCRGSRRAHGLTEDAVRRLVAEHTSGRTWGVLGEPRVNVLELNIAVLAGS